MDMSSNMAKLQVQTGEETRPPGAQPSAVEKIEQLLEAKDDTSRFVGLALLKSTLDNSEDLQNDKEVIISLWNSIPPKFLDRLLRTGSKSGPKQGNAKDMLELSVAVLYTFTVLLPNESKSDPKLLGRIPLLVEAVLQSSEETTDIILKTLLTLVSSSPEGCTTFVAVEDWSPLIEIAPKQPLVLSILTWSWIYAKSEDVATLSSKIDKAFVALTASYKGTDAVTLLDFLAKVLSRLNQDLIPQEPEWLNSVVEFIRGLVTSKPTSAGREAYTNCAANLLVTYPKLAFQNLFGHNSMSSKPFDYIFISLILIDIRSCLPSLLEKLNTPEYPTVSERITSDLIILSFFIEYLVQQMERAESESVGTRMFMDYDLILKLRSSIAESLSLLMEYLRDRWDAAIAGVQGLHPEARYGESHTASGSYKTLAWDSKHELASDDKLLLAALRVLGEWLREDDGEQLRNEAIGLMDVLMDLYQPDSTKKLGATARPLVLGVLDGIIQTEDGIHALLEHNGWSILSKDLLDILAHPTDVDKLAYEPSQHILGQHVAALLTALNEVARATPEDWLDFATGVAAYDAPSQQHPQLPLQQMWADVLQLTATLLVKAPSGVKRRYLHSAKAVVSMASVILEKALDDGIARVIKGSIALLASDAIFGL
ncbi:Neurochondrin-domain-containing protein [Xylariales sp. AK1849]|nr:Neurochondrin-domain-containing protein [Xylariales sp. AK1849]